MLSATPSFYVLWGQGETTKTENVTKNDYVLIEQKTRENIKKTVANRQKCDTIIVCADWGVHNT